MDDGLDDAPKEEGDKLPDGLDALEGVQLRCEADSEDEVSAEKDQKGWKKEATNLVAVMIRIPRPKVKLVG